MKKILMELWIPLILMILATSLLIIVYRTQSISHLGVAISAIGVFIALYISYRQKKIYDKQGGIIDDVKDITVSLKTAEYIRGRAKDFFRESDNKTDTYQCIYPYQEDKRRPMPHLRPGDAFAILTLRDLLGKERFLQNGFGVISKEEPTLSDDDNLAIICSKLLEESEKGPFPKVEEYNESVDDESLTQIFNNLPCWFVKTKNTNIKYKDYVPAIMVLEERNEPIFSKSDKFYYDNDEYKEKETSLEFSIISRIKNSDGRYYFLMAGIHSTGTWVAAKYVDKKVCAVQPESYSHSTHLFSSDDFIAIIYGRFSWKTFEVDDNFLKVYQNYFWWKESGNKNWRKFSESDG